MKNPYVRKKEIENFIGVSENVPYETPIIPDVEIDSNIESIENSIKKIIEKLQL